MNIFTIELIQTALSLLPFLIAFSLLFSSGVGTYWILPTCAFLLNSAYRGYMLYQASPGEEIITGTEALLEAFAPSMVNLLLFFAMLSIQISLQRRLTGSPPEQQKLLGSPPAEDHDSGIKEEGTKKKIALDISPPTRSVVSTHYHEQKMDQLRDQIAQIRGELEAVLELAAYNGQLKKPRKRKKVPKRRKKKRS